MKSEQPPLPIWARMLADSLPQTTGLMLELDAVHRLKNPLGPKLRGQIRWIVADENQCHYAKKVAEADLHREGIVDWAITHSKSEDANEKAFQFARKMTKAAYTVTDEEVEELVKILGPAKSVALVHTIAHANFQDRIFLALGLNAQSEEPLPPVEIKFNGSDQLKLAPARPNWDEAVKQQIKVNPLAPDWLVHSLTDLRSSLDRQKSLRGRIPLPDWDQVKLPTEVKQRSGKIVWSVVSLGYQPLVTKAWFDCMSAFQREAQFNRVFSNTYFWVITRTNECFY